MNDSTSGRKTTITGVVIPANARAVLVSPDATSQLVGRPIAAGESVLNIERDLLKHLNEKPYSTPWLAMLRDYCDQRIAAREAASAGNYFTTPAARFDWEMHPLDPTRVAQ